jgi:hypothetical protein
LTSPSRTPAGIAYDRAGPRDGLPVVLAHMPSMERPQDFLALLDDWW